MLNFNKSNLTINKQFIINFINIQVNLILNIIYLLIINFKYFNTIIIIIYIILLSGNQY